MREDFVEAVGPAVVAAGGAAPPLSGRPAFWGQPKFVGHRCSISLYMETTCKRISHKLLRNVVKFFDIIVNHDMGSEGFRVIQHTHTNEFMEPNENELSLALQVEISFARPSGDAVPISQREMRAARVSESERVDRGVPCGKPDNTRRMMSVAPEHRT